MLSTSLLLHCATKKTRRSALLYEGLPFHGDFSFTVLAGGIPGNTGGRRGGNGKGGNGKNGMIGGGGGGVKKGIGGKLMKGGGDGSSGLGGSIEGGGKKGFGGSPNGGDGKKKVSGRLSPSFSIIALVLTAGGLV